MRKNNSYNYCLCIWFFGVSLLAMLFCGCIRESDEDKPKNNYISIRIFQNSPQKSRVHQGMRPGEGLDNVVQSLRILAFNPDGGIESNVYYYPVENGDVIEHSIRTGNYDFVFVANEPTDSKATLDNIQNMGSLKMVAFASSAFNSNLPIPMFQKIDDVTITADGTAILHKGTNDIHGIRGNYAVGATTNEIVLKLDRLAARVDITLVSNVPLNTSTNIALSNLPSQVPLFASEYGSVAYTSGRGLTAQNVRVYADGIDYIYEYQANRVIIPSSNDDTQRIILIFPNLPTINNWIELKIDDGNYTLPYNSWLDVMVRYKMKVEVINRSATADSDSVEVNITTRDW